jgi:holliday junction DNA helicase RuvA
LIGWLKGNLLQRGGDGEVLVDVNGIGYRVSVPSTALATLGESGSKVELFVHTHVREDAIILYGFPTASERGCFEALIGAHGVGPSLALSVLSSLRPDSLVRAVIDGDLETLCSVPGIGRKTAARLVLDLKTKLALPEDEVISVRGDGTPGPRTEVRGALQELGYGPEEIRRALGAVSETGTVEDLLRQALKELASSGNHR